MCEVKNNKNDHKRSRLMCFMEDFMEHYDIVAFQELFGSFSSKRDKFLKRIGQYGFKYYVTCPTPKCGFVVDGGLAIISKFPIVEADFYSYPHGTHSDTLAEKGVLYTKISVNGSFINLFNTHLQASYQDASGSQSYGVREDQLKLLINFILKKTIESDSPTVLVGDFNINARAELPENEDSQEYVNLMSKLNNSFFSATDILHVEHGKHSVTFADVLPDEGTGRCLPRETILTHHSDFCSQQRIDYIFLLQKKREGTQADVKQFKKGTIVVDEPEVVVDEERVSKKSKKKKKKGNKKEGGEETGNAMKTVALGSDDVLLEVVPKTTKVQPFFTDPSLITKFTQLSDHYGIETVLKVNHVS